MKEDLEKILGNIKKFCEKYKVDVTIDTEKENKVMTKTETKVTAQIVIR